MLFDRSFELADGTFVECCALCGCPEWPGLSHVCLAEEKLDECVDALLADEPPAP
jgi:hypothetical protein